MQYILLGLFIYIAISWIIAQEFQEIALKKGYNEKKYFWFSFLFGFAGYLMIIALPIRETKNEAAVVKTIVSSGDDQQIDYVGNFPVQEFSEDAGIKQCPDCGVCYDSACKDCPSCKRSS